MGMHYSDISLLDSDIQGQALERDSELQRKEIDAGTIGRLVGIGENVGRNIAGFVIISSLVAGIGIMLVSVYRGGPVEYECWKYLTPLIFGSMGYLFGRSSDTSPN